MPGLFLIVTPGRCQPELYLELYLITVGYNYGISIAIQKAVFVQKANCIHLIGFAVTIAQLFKPRDSHDKCDPLMPLEEK